MLRRACADEWPYDPAGVQPDDEVVVRVFLIPEHAVDRRRVGVATARHTARLVLAGRAVKHFEVLSTAVDGLRVVPHGACGTEGCRACRGLGSFLVPDGSDRRTYVMGWAATLR